MNIENLYSSSVLPALRKRLLPYDDENLAYNAERMEVDSIIEGYTPKQAFDEYCNWNGLIGHASQLIGAWNELATSTIITIYLRERINFHEILDSVDQVFRLNRVNILSGIDLIMIHYPHGMIRKEDMDDFLYHAGSIGPNDYSVSYAHHGR